MAFTIIKTLAALLILNGSVTTGRPEYKKARVVEHIGDKDEAPAWTSGESVLTEEASDAVFINVTTIAGNSRPEVYIKENVVSSGQLNEVSAADDPAFASLTAFFSLGKIIGSKISELYWEDYPRRWFPESS